MNAPIYKLGARVIAMGLEGSVRAVREKGEVGFLYDVEADGEHGLVMNGLREAKLKASVAVAA